KRPSGEARPLASVFPCCLYWAPLAEAVAGTRTRSTPSQTSCQIPEATPSPRAHFDILYSVSNAPAGKWNFDTTRMPLGASLSRHTLNLPFTGLDTDRITKA